MNEKSELLLLEMIKNTNDAIEKTNKNLEHIRNSNHEMVNRFSEVSGLVQLLRGDLANEKQNTKEAFVRVHHRIDSEVKEIHLLKKELQDVAPSVKDMSQSFTWAKRLVVTALVMGVLWASVQAFMAK